MACAAALCGTAAGATDFVWTSGALSSSGVPTMLQAQDSLSIGVGGAKSVDLDFVTTGAVNWADNLRVAPGRYVSNFAQWSTGNDVQLYGDGKFENWGIFRKSGGSGVTWLSTAGLLNFGTLAADSGTLAINSPGATFEAGTRFEGAGRIQIVNNARFVNDLNSQNLQFVAGTFTGAPAYLAGQAAFLGGSFAGTWSILPGSSLNARSGTAKAVGGTMAVGGTLRLEDALSLGGTLSVDSGGVVDLANDSGIAGSGLLDNMGELRKSGGAGSAVVSVAYHGAGVVNTQSGSLVFSKGADFFGANWFTGAGQTQIASLSSVSGPLFSDNLVLVAGGRLVGTASAELHGTLGWTGGSLGGDWQITSGGRLRATAGSRKTLEGWTFVEGTLELLDSVVFGSTAAVVENRGTLVLTGNAGLGFGGSGTPTESLINQGLLRKDGGGTSAISGLAVRNSGTVEVRAGTLLFDGVDQRFEAGTQFNGGGTAQLIRSASFSGTYAANGRLLLAAGSFQGGSGGTTAVTAHGLTDWSGGTLTGRWSLAGDALWRVLPGSGKTLAGRLDNTGHLLLADWMLMTPSAWLDNSGTLELVGGAGLQASFISSNVANRGLIVKTGDGSDAVFSGVELDNQAGGVVDVRAGRLVLTGFNTVNRGTLRGSGGYRALTLSNFGHLAPGTDAWPTAPLTLEGDLVQFGSLDIGVFGAQDFGRLWVSGATTLAGGTLALSCVAGCDLAAGTELVVLHSQGGLYGSFNQLVTSGFAVGAFEFSVTANDVVVRVTQHAAAVPEPPVWLLGLAGGALLARRRRRGGPGSPRPQALPLGAGPGA